MINKEREWRDTMNITAIIAIVITCLFIPVSAFSSDLGTLRVSLIEGDAQVKMAESDEWVPLSVNTPLRDGDRLWVPDEARLELNLRDGTFVRLDENSSLEVLSADRDSFQFYINSGHAYINFRGVRDGVMQIDTPLSSIRAYDKTKFMVDVTGNGRTEIAVLKGLVYAESRSGRTRVNSGRVLNILDDGDADLYALGPADAWERWNRERDARYEDRSYASSRYLPDELDSYAYDFDDNGRWVQVREYGYVWTPTVYISAGWSPYRQGRWIWVGGDYVWISYEPWGWAPYHYGRWAHVASIGWCWVPPARGSVYWGPGYVGWVHTPTYVAWVPLAPEETYYGYGFYGPHSINLININIQKTVIRHDHKHARVHNAVVVQHNDTFRTGKHIEFKPRENPFLGQGGTFGRPTVTSGRGLAMPVVREIQQSKLPPRQLREVQVSDLKRERPLVKEKHMAVIAGDAVQKSMPLREVEEQRQRQFKSSVAPSGIQKQAPAEQTGKTEAVKQPESMREIRARTTESRKGADSEPAARIHDPRKSPVEKPADRSTPSSERRILTPGEPSVPPSSTPSREIRKRSDSEPSAPVQIPGRSSGETRSERAPKVREATSQQRWPSALPEKQPAAPQTQRSEGKKSSAPAIQPGSASPAPVSPAQPPKAEKPRKEAAEPKQYDTPAGAGMGGLRGSGSGR